MNRWQLSLGKLNELRGASFEASMERNRTYFDGHDDSAPIVYHEQGVLMLFYKIKIQELVKFFKYPQSVSSVCIMFFDWFYTKWSVVDYDPRVVMIACFLFGSKVENIHVTIDDICRKIPDVKPSTVRETELILAKTLDFWFVVYSPYEPLYGFFLDSQKMVEDHEHLHKAYLSSVELVHESYLTDVNLTYNPSLVAACILFHECKSYGVDLTSYFKGKVFAQVSSQIFYSVEDIMKKIREVSRPEVGMLREISSKLEKIYERKRAIRLEEAGEVCSDSD